MQQQNEHGTQRHKRNPKYELLNRAKSFGYPRASRRMKNSQTKVLTNTARFPYYERRKTTRGAVKRSTVRQTRRIRTPKFQGRRRAKITMEPLVSPLAPSTSFTASPPRNHRDSKTSNGEAPKTRRTNPQHDQNPQAKTSQCFANREAPAHRERNPLHHQEKQQQHLKSTAANMHGSETKSHRESRRRNLTGFGRSSRRMGGEAEMNRETRGEERSGGRSRDRSHLPWWSSQEREERGRERMRSASMQGKRGGTLYPAPPTPRLRPPLACLSCFVRWLGSPGSASAPARLGVATAGPVHAARVVISDLPFTALSRPAQSGRRLETKTRFQCHQ
jgi:hypothetical protein